MFLYVLDRIGWDFNFLVYSLLWPCCQQTAGWPLYGISHQLPGLNVCWHHLCTPDCPSFSLKVRKCKTAKPPAGLQSWFITGIYTTTGVHSYVVNSSRKGLTLPLNAMGEWKGQYTRVTAINISVFLTVFWCLSAENFKGHERDMALKNPFLWWDGKLLSLFHQREARGTLMCIRSFQSLTSAKENLDPE